MTEATANRAVDFAVAEAERTNEDHLEIVFFGGEPLMRADLLLRICDRVKAKANGRRASFKTSTNGLLLDDALLDALVARGVFLSLSVDGAPETNDRQRLDVLGRGTSSKLEAIIPRLLEVNPCTAVNCVVTPESAHAIDRSVRWLFDVGFRYISTALDHGAEWDRDALDALGAGYARLADWYVERSRLRDKLYLSCFDQKIDTRARAPLEARDRCALGIRQFSIAPSGRLYPCVQFVREDEDPTFAIGDVERGFDDTKRHAIHGRSESPKSECGGCAIADRCASWCACVNWQSTGALDRASPLVCEHERILTPIADRVANRLWKRRDPLFIHKHYNPAFPVLSFVEDLIVKERES